LSGIVDTLISAAVGFAAGMVGSTVNERLKSGVGSLEAELKRLDDLHDKITSLLLTPPAERISLLREATAMRRRLGINLRALVTDAPAFQSISQRLSRLDRVIGDAEDGAPSTPEREQELEEIARGVRQAVKSRSVLSGSWRLLRGR